MATQTNGTNVGCQPSLSRQPKIRLDRMEAQRGGSEDPWPQSAAVGQGHACPSLPASAGPPGDRSASEQTQGCDPRLVELRFGHVSQCPLHAGQSVTELDPFQPVGVARSVPSEMRTDFDQRGEQQAEGADHDDASDEQAGQP